MRVRVGVQLWPTNGAAQLRDSATRAEQVGFTDVTVADHLSDRLLPPFVASAVVAEVTERVGVGVLVLNNDFRHPVLVAREAAALADISGGRFLLGLGAGHMRHECERIGRVFDPPDVRVERLEESITIVRRLLSAETVDHKGVYYTVKDETTWPPVAETLPILIGGNTPALLACAARNADIVGLIGFTAKQGGKTAVADAFTCDALARQIEQVRIDAGDREISFHGLVQWVDVSPRRRLAAERAAEALEIDIAVALDSPYVLIGTVSEIREQLSERTARLGVDYWTVFEGRPGEHDYDTISALAPVLEAL